jgi:hypothetical protein
LGDRETLVDVSSALGYNLLELVPEELLHFLVHELRLEGFLIEVH